MYIMKKTNLRMFIRAAAAFIVGASASWYGYASGISAITYGGIAVAAVSIYLAALVYVVDKAPIMEEHF